MLRIGIECENIEDPKSRWGVGQLTFNLLSEYVKNPEWQKKFELYLYFKKRIPDDDIFKIQNSKFKIRVLGFPSFNVFYHILMPLRAMMDGLDWMFFPAYMLPPLYLGRSIVLLTSDVYYEYKHGNLPFRYRLAYALFTNWAAIKAKKILAISETSKKEIAKLYRIESDKIFTSYLGVDSHKTMNYKLETGNYLLYVGQMFPRRHARETILAFKKLITEHSNILQNVRMLDLRLIIVGKDKYPVPIIDDLVKNTNQELGSERIIRHDYLEKREDIDKLYAEARALIYVSDREAFGLPPMEALSFGVPPIVMDNELGHELFGEYAFYAKSESVEDVADSIKQALSNEQKVMNIRKNGLEFVKKYNWKSFMENVFSEFE